MELELGLRITRTGEESTSTNLRIVKDRAGPVFFSRETEKMFILTVHLKGFKRERIKMEINEDETRIAISGEKPVQELVMVGLIMHRKEKTIIGFRKVFRIPEGVVSDRIKAKFDEEDSILTISMPKSVKGFIGIVLEEVKEEEVDGGEKSEPTPVETVGITETNHNEESPQPEPEQSLIETKRERNPIEETSSGTPEIGIEDESEEIIPTEIPETIVTKTSEPEREIITEPTELESKPPDSLPSEETPREPTLELQEQTSKQELPEPEINTQEQEPEEKPDLCPETAEQAEVEPDQAFEPPETPEEGTKQEITHDNHLIKDEDTQKDEEPPEIQEVDKPMDASKQIEEEEEEEEEDSKSSPSRSSSVFCGSCIFAGSTLIGLLIALVIQLLRKRKINGKKRKQ